MKIAIHNFHLNKGFAYHPYIEEIFNFQEVRGLYISDRSIASHIQALKSGKYSQLLEIQKRYDLDLVFSMKELNSKYDVLLDLNLVTSNLNSDLPEHIKRFSGVKVFHIGDYFAYHSSIDKHKYLSQSGITALLGYCMHDLHCEFFRNYYPDFVGKVWGVPFGYSSRFKKMKPFTEREDRAISLGSLFKLNNEVFKDKMFFEPIDFFSHEIWFHRFRRALFENRSEMNSLVECEIPDPDSQSTRRIDLVEALNRYKLFVTCESIFNFPTAKVYEGMACGSVLLASKSDVYCEIGLKNNETFIEFEYENIDDMKERITYYLNNQELLSQIADNSLRKVKESFNPATIAKFIIEICGYHYRNSDQEAFPYSEYENQLGKNKKILS